MRVKSLEIIRSLLSCPCWVRLRQQRDICFKAKYVSQSFDILCQSHTPFPSQSHQIIKLSAKHSLSPSERFRCKSNRLRINACKLLPSLPVSPESPILPARSDALPGKERHSQRPKVGLHLGNWKEGGAVTPPDKRWTVLPASWLPL